MKKFMSLVLTLMLLVSTMSVCAFSVQAADAVVFTIETLDYNEGDVITKGTQFDVDISAGAHSGITSMAFKFRYNKTLMKPVAFEMKGFFATMSSKEVVLEPAEPVIGKNHATYGEVWISSMNLDAVAITEGEVLATVTFEAIEDITTSAPIFGFGYDDSLATDENYDQIMAEYVDGGIKFPVVATTTTTTTAAEDGTATTTAAEDDTTTTAATEETTTTTKKKTDNPKTGEGDEWIVPVVIGGIAVLAIGAAVAMAVISKKRQTEED